MSPEIRSLKAVPETPAPKEVVPPQAPGAVAPSLVNWDDPLLTCLSIIAGLLERPISTKALKAGDMLTYVISQGNAEYGLPAVPDFVGYVALTGSFNYCHGFGYISAAGAGPTSNGMSVSIAPLIMNATRTSPESLGN